MNNFQDSPLYAFKCGLCNNKTFYNKHFMIKHIKHTHVKLRYPCENCDKSFSSVDLLNIHFRSSHLGLKPYSCLYCNKAFSTNIALHNHIDIKHEFKSEYKCECCNKTFDKKLPLYRDRPKQVKTKVHKCRFCPKKFSTSRDKQVHLLRHKKLRNLAKCQVCDKSFRNKVGLARHTLSYHEKVSCIFCDKIFTGHQQLDNHIRLHTNEKAFECKVCGKEFGTSALRKSHLRTHLQQQQQGNGNVREEICRIEVGLDNLTLQDFRWGGGKRLYKCRVCRKEFISYEAKRFHMNEHIISILNIAKFEKAYNDMEDSEFDSNEVTRPNSCHF